MQKIKNFLQHHLNPLHVYCRLRSVGFDPSLAQRMSLAYERYLYKFIQKTKI
jgi:hypothetical protein